MNRSDILDAAKAATMGDRNQQYGDPYDQLSHTAGLWSAYLATTGEDVRFPELNADDVANMLALMKISRAKVNPYTCHDDNYVDGAAYMAIAGECRAEEVRREAEWMERIQPTVIERRSCECDECEKVTHV